MVNHKAGKSEAQRMLAEKYSSCEGRTASHGYILKLARVMQTNHSTSFDEQQFCAAHNIKLRKFK
jgi:hypothetical protein